MSKRVVRDARRIGARPFVAGLVLLLCYLAVSLLTDPGGYLGTDTGTKVYTLEVMAERGSFSPDYGYWAEEHDPSGSLHPVHQTKRQPDGGWVGVTTLPMLEAAQPLYRLGGYRAVLLLPMLAGVAAAFAARQVMRRLDPGNDGWAAYWVVGLASPVLVYALDFWEHTAGLACILGATAVLLGVLDDQPPWRAAFAGALLGLGAVMRQEVLVYALVLVGGTCGVLLVRRRTVVGPLSAGAAAVAGFAVPWLLNGVLESSVEGQSRAARSSGAAAGASSTSASTLVQRVEEGVQTFLGLVSGEAALSAVLGAAVVATVVVALRAERRGDLRFVAVALSAAAVVYVADAAGGLGYVPGMLTAFPLAIGGLVAWRRGARLALVVAVALASLPLVYAFQYLGGAAPQWGGRYTLASGSLLGLAALAGLRDRNPVVLRSLVALSALVTALGAAWLVERSHAVDRFFDRVVSESEPVVIARQAFLLREAGAGLVDRRWLSVEDEQEFTRAVDVARTVGEERFTVLEWDGEAPPAAALPDDVREVERQRLRFVDTPVGLVTYEFTR